MPAVTVTFPGGLAVDAVADGFIIKTDQPVSSGGANTAPEPYTLFLTSIVTCAGFYVQRFCQQRQLSTEGMSMTLNLERNMELRRVEKIRMVIHLPQGFPEKYHQAVIRAAGMCSVKKVIMDPPEFDIITETAKLT